MAGQPQPLAGLQSTRRQVNPSHLATDVEASQATGGAPTARRRRHRTEWKEAQALSVMSDCGAQARLDTGRGPPLINWYYLDDMNVEHGPMRHEKMRTWFAQGLFPVGSSC